MVEMITNNIVESACKNFLIVDFTVSKPSLKKALPKQVASKIAELIAATSGEGAITPPDSVVKLFGPWHKEFNDLVLQPLGQFRNKLYKRVELDGGRAFTVAEFPTAYPELKAEADEIMAKIAESVDTEWTKWTEAGISSAIRTYEKVYPDVERWIRMAIPTPQEFLKNNGIHVGLPRRIDTNVLSGIALPADLMHDIQQRQVADAESKLEGARKQAIQSVEDHLALIAKQLDGGERLSNSLITNLQGSATMLRQFVEAYDNDPRITETLKLIDESISSIPSAEVWKNSMVASEKSRVAAVRAGKQLASVKERKLPAPAVADDLAIGEGGMLADLL